MKLGKWCHSAALGVRSKREEARSIFLCLATESCRLSWKWNMSSSPPFQTRLTSNLSPASSASWDPTVTTVGWLNKTNGLLSENRYRRRFCQIVHSKVSRFPQKALILILCHHQWWKQTKNESENKKSPSFWSQIKNTNILEMQRKTNWLKDREKLYMIIFKIRTNFELFFFLLGEYLTEKPFYM